MADILSDWKRWAAVRQKEVPTIRSVSGVAGSVFFVEATQQAVETPKVEQPKPKAIDLTELLDDAKKAKLNDVNATQELSKAAALAVELDELGFHKVSKPLLAKTKFKADIEAKLGYPVVAISPEKIIGFLKRLDPGGEVRDVTEYAQYTKGHGPYSLGVVSADHSGSWSMYKTTVWKEVPVAEYPNIPPDHVLKKFAEVKSKGAYDYYTIASVETTVVEVKDPLLLGRMEGSDIRYFIAQWGDDVSLDDLI